MLICISLMTCGTKHLLLRGFPCRTWIPTCPRWLFTPPHLLLGRLVSSLLISESSSNILRKQPASSAHCTCHLLLCDSVHHPLEGVLHWTEVPNLKDQCINLLLYVESFLCLRNLCLPQIYEAIFSFYILKAILIYHSQKDFYTCYKGGSRHQCFPLGQMWIMTVISSGTIDPKCLLLLQRYVVPPSPVFINHTSTRVHLVLSSSRGSILFIAVSMATASQ